MKAKVISFFEYDAIKRLRIEIRGILIPDMRNLLISFNDTREGHINISNGFAVPKDFEIVAEIEVTKTFIDKALRLTRLYETMRQDIRDLWHSNAPVPF